LSRWEGGDVQQMELGFGAEGATYFGYKLVSGAREPGPFVVRERAGVWRAVLSQKDMRRNVPSAMMSPPVGSRVVGMCTDPWGESQPLLVVLQDDKRTFSLVASAGESAPRRLSPRASDEVAFAAVSHALPLLAWLTVNGEVGLWNFQQQRLVYRSAPGGSP
jgi:hypothetical protein